MNGKGDKTRPGKPGAYARGYAAIDWSKGRKPAPPRKVDVGRVLIADGEGTRWTVPSLTDLLTDSRQTKCPGRAGCDNHSTEEHTCPYATEINDDNRLCTCCADCQHECAMDI